MRNVDHTMQNYYDCINYMKTMKVNFPSRSCSVNNVVASFFIHSFSFIKKLPNLKTITSHWHTDDWRVFENPVVQTNTFWMSQVCQASLYLRFDCSSQFWGSHLCDHQWMCCHTCKTYRCEHSWHYHPAVQIGKTDDDRMCLHKQLKLIQPADLKQHFSLTAITEKSQPRS